MSAQFRLDPFESCSPINDLLEKGEFTLENLLEEDELIQEVKAKNERLIEWLVMQSAFVLSR
jgi:hypothetical protein